MTENEFKKCFTLLENEFGKQNDIMRESWYKFFSIYKVEDLEEVIEHYLKKIKEFPDTSLFEDIEWIVKCRKDDEKKAYREAVKILKVGRPNE